MSFGVLNIDMGVPIFFKTCGFVRFVLEIA